MSYLLDTNVLSELRRPALADPRVVRWARGQDSSRHFISVLTLMEIERGIVKKERTDARAGAVLRKWFDDDVLSRFAERTIPVDRLIARLTAQLPSPDPLPGNDSLIAGTAIIHGLTVVTRNTKHFESTGVPMVNPWEFED
ncbi:type II toxin-antitoxin system VapC family toxin [Tsukamurella spumae]|uniref:Ribonuclease VapC n=1 Tax=Tsukamurella spumae TaxID=44753 RepID=A0A846WYY9_9ACTN|nr:type II toxin-antitoxin system VapC family toxin [Tsukamurella spumae]NKY16980.1 type II toxin-antitoxin system VapC family toxin [Tsukamurella spumae]